MVVDIGYFTNMFCYIAYKIFASQNFLLLKNTIKITVYLKKKITNVVNR